MVIKHVAAAIVGIVIFGSLAFADTVTVDFEDTTPGNRNLAFSHGFRFFNDTFQFFIGSDNNGSNFFSPAGDNIFMSRIDGLPFDLLRMDLRILNPPDLGFDALSILGNFVGGSFQFMTFFPEDNQLYQTFDVGWNNLRGVTFIGFGATDIFAVDNIVTNVQVPEPSTLATLASGILVVLIVYRRKTKARQPRTVMAALGVDAYPPEESTIEQSEV